MSIYIKCGHCKKKFSVEGSSCGCEKLLCECGHTLGMHRFLKSVKPTACVFVFGTDEKGFGLPLTNKKGFCSCDCFKEKKK